MASPFFKTKTMKVIFLKDHNSCSAGSEHDIDDSTAEYLIRCKVAEKVEVKAGKEKVEMKATKEKKEHGKL